MRQKAAFVPAEKAEGLLCICKRTERRIPSFDKPAKIFALGSRWNGHIQTLTRPLSWKPIHWSAGLRHGASFFVRFIIAPCWKPAFQSFYHRAVPEASAPIHAWAINCRSTYGRMPPCW